MNGNFDQWNHEYNQLQLIGKQFNACYRVNIRHVIFWLTLLTVGSNVLAIQLALGVSLTAIGISLATCAFTFTMALLNMAASIQNQTGETLWVKRRALNSDPYCRKCIRAKQTIAFGIASMFKNPKDSVTSVAAATVDYTNSCLVAIGSAK